MLFDASTVYAPGEPRGDAGYSQYQNVGLLGRYHLGALKSPNVVIGLAVLVVVAYWLHKRGGKR